MFRIFEKLERMAAAAGMAEGGDFDAATDILNGTYGKPGLHSVRDAEKKQPPRPRPRLRV